MADNWMKTKLGDVLTLHRGFDLPNSKRREGRIPVVSSSGITGYHAEAKVPGPGVVTGRYGTLGEVYYIKEDFWPLNTTLFVSDFKGNNRRFIAYFLQHLQLGQYNGAAAVPGIDRNVVHQAEVRIPPLLTQSKIASVLSAYDDLIEKNLRRIRILEEISKALFSEWFVKLRFPGNELSKMSDSPFGIIPAKWRVRKFTEVAEVLSGGTPPTDVPDYWNGPIPFFTPRDATGAYFVIDTEKHITKAGLDTCNSQLYAPRTVFITARGTVGSITMPATEMAMNQSCYALKGLAGISQEFLFLLTQDRQDYLKKNTGGATFETIVIDTFQRMDVLVPPAEIITNFTAAIKPVFDLLETLSKQAVVLRQSRDLLLPKLVSGEMDLSGLDVAVEEGGQ